jgi:hypothetical protein
MEAGSGADLLAELEAEQVRLWQLLRVVAHEDLARRPANGNWSVLENTRHLLFAEEAHLGRFVPGGPSFSPLGLPPPGMQGGARTLPAGTAEPSSLTDVLDAWGASHASARAFLRGDSPQVQQALVRNLRHLRLHIRLIERLLRTR